MRAEVGHRASSLPGPGSASASLAWVGVALVSALPAVVLAVMGYHRRWVSEDAFITLRVARNLLAGLGPVYNPGERVEAYTHPLWLGILWLWGALGGSLEIGAVALGLLLTLGGLLAAQAGALRLSGHAVGGLVLPLGAVVFAAIPAVWDFATSGLETGLTFGWLGIGFWLLARACAPDDRGTSERRWWYITALVLGLGPLIRPDLALFSGAFLLALLIGYSRLAGGMRAINGGGPILLAAAILPLGYQLFRMGYFAAVVPNTALAKEAGDAYWTQGQRYAADFVGTYALWAPLLPLLGWWSATTVELWDRRNRAAALSTAAPVCAAVLHGLWVIRVGGDFMHARFLLPTIFGALLPVMAVRLPALTGRRISALFTLAVAVPVLTWALICALWLRVPYAGGSGPAEIADERGFYARHAGRANPVTADDYAASSWSQDGLALRARAEQRRSDPGAPRVLLTAGQEFLAVPTVSADVDLVSAGGNISLLGYNAGLRVAVIDVAGLGDPIAARLQVEMRGRPGHEKGLSTDWVIARYGVPTDGDTLSVQAARQALGCGDLAALRQAVEEPLTAERFLRNTWLAWRLHHLRIPGNPLQAQVELC